METITLNQDQRLFVVPAGEGFTCLGFDVVFGHCKELARRIKKLGLLKPGAELAPVLESEIGTPEQYQQYRNLLAIVGDRKIGTWFSFETPTAIRTILEQYRKNGGRLRVFYGDRNTGRCWMEENDMVGRVSRSTGRMQIPILIADDDFGGPGLLDSCIVRIMDADTRAELYRLKSYHLPEMEIHQASPDLVRKGYSHGVWVKSKEGAFENHANFRSYGKAAQWVAFMSGECMEQPQ